jgi:hypothetical protein
MLATITNALSLCLENKLPIIVFDLESSGAMEKAVLGDIKPTPGVIVSLFNKREDPGKVLFNAIQAYPTAWEMSGDSLHSALPHFYLAGRLREPEEIQAPATNLQAPSLRFNPSVCPSVCPSVRMQRRFYRKCGRKRPVRHHFHR